MLQACILDFKESWVKYLSLAEFAYNNSYQASIGMAPFEALYRRKCRTPICWDEVGERKINDIEFVEISSEKIQIVRERLKVAQGRQKSYADYWWIELEFEVDDMVFLKVAH